MKRFVAIAGNIGVGKSTLTALLRQQLNWEPFFEAVKDNPYLADFYKDMRRWSFHSQIYFLSRRLRHHWQLLQRTNSVIQDRTVYEDAEIFARNLYQQDLMDRIQRRGRPFERDIAASYLEQLNQLYEEWIDGFSLCPVLTVPSDDLDFVLNPDHLELITEKILEKLQGREEVVFDSR
jgi:deoxyadenosine/deoxycytidine kinase